MTGSAIAWFVFAYLTRFSCQRYLRESAKSEVKEFYTRIEKFNFKLAISDRLGLSNQLIQPLLDHTTVALAVNVNSVRSSRFLPIDANAIVAIRSEVTKGIYWTKVLIGTLVSAGQKHNALFARLDLLSVV